MNVNVDIKNKKLDICWRKKFFQLSRLEYESQIINSNIQKLNYKALQLWPDGLHWKDARRRKLTAIFTNGLSDNVL